jgi:pSer/pThr/pTyr-binding forkhead associated (FHA) protein
MTGNEAFIGRGDQCQIQLRDGSVSRKHARIERLGSKFWIEDLDSPNGVFVNSRRISRRALLAEGVVIELGQSLLRFAPPADNRPSADVNATPNLPVQSVKPPPPPPEALEPEALPVAEEPPPHLELVSEQTDKSVEPEVVPVNEPQRTLGVADKVMIGAGVALMVLGGVAAVILS